MIGRATSLHRAGIWAVLPLFCACASAGGAGSHEPRVVPHQGATVRALPVDTTPASRARILVGVNAAGIGDNWTEIAVSSQSDLGRKICETLVENQMRVLTGASLHVRINRPCSAAPLDSVKVAVGEYILVAERVISDVYLLLLMPQEPVGLKDAGRTTVTDFARFPSKDDCQKALAKIATIRQQDRAAADEAARGWLKGQIREQEGATKQACEEKDQVEARCAALPGGKAEIKMACGASTKSRRCEEAKQRAMERSRCAVDQERVGRSCDIARAALEAVRKRLATPQDEEPDKASAPSCHEI